MNLILCHFQTEEEFQLLNGFRPGKQQQTRKNNDRHVLKEKNLKLESTGGFALGLKKQPKVDVSRLPRAVDWRRGSTKEKQKFIEISR